MVEYIEVWCDAKEGFAQIVEDGNVKDAIGIQMAETNVVVSEQITKKGMSGNSKSLNKVGLKRMSSWVWGVGNSSLAAGRHPAVSISRRMPSITNLLRSSLEQVDVTHSRSWLV